MEPALNLAEPPLVCRPVAAPPRFAVHRDGSIGRERAQRFIQHIYRAHYGATIRSWAHTPGTAKVTFTSGTTGTPKGVCLSAAAMDAVADGLVAGDGAAGHRAPPQCALPFAVLLENIAGLMAPRRQGATLITLPLAAGRPERLVELRPGRSTPRCASSRPKA
jgi:long-subunit acyl-CoA synthetase (AMP-forming)